MNLRAVSYRPQTTNKILFFRREKTPSVRNVNCVFLNISAIKENKKTQYVEEIINNWNSCLQYGVISG